jgi:hypothetical protein
MGADLNQGKVRTVWRCTTSVSLPRILFIRPHAEFRIMPRDFTAAATGRHRKRYDLGIIRRTGVDMPAGFPALTP